jgi:hypothetical protein
MPYTLYDSGEGEKRKPGATSIAPGVVTNNCDLIMQGKVQVRIPSMGLDVWARVLSSGGGNGRGEIAVGKPGDEVLVAFNAEDVRDAFILGGLHSNLKRPPITLPTDPQTKRIIQTGEVPGVGHRVELDDMLQAITIRATTGQTIMLSLTGIQIMANPTTAVNLTASPGGGPGAVQVMVGDNVINVSPAGVDIFSSKTINLTAAAINLNGTNVTVRGVNLLLNS